MSSLIRLTSGDFLDKFIKKYDYSDYRFLLISEAIKTKKHKNVFALSCLIPPTNAMSEYIANGYTEKYVKKYVQHLKSPKIDLLLSTIVRMVVIENRNVVLMCSDNEDDFKYLKILSDYIEATYGVKVYSYKKYSKDPKKCEKIKDKKKIAKTIEKRIKKLSENPEVTFGSDSKNVDIQSRLKEASKSELKAYCKENSIKIKKDDKKKDIIKRIMKTIS